MTSPSPSLAGDRAALALAGRHRLRLWEPIPWILALAFFFAFPKHLGFGTELLVTILFAISLDLVLGYAGIVTLGHAAFFGAGAYSVGMLAKHGVWTEPITGLILAAVVAANLGHDYTGGVDGLDSLPITRSPGYSGSIRCTRRRSISTSSPSCSCASSSCAPGLLALRPELDGDPREHAADV